MAIVLADWSVTRSNGNIRYIGNDHGGGSLPLGLQLLGIITMMLRR